MHLDRQRRRDLSLSIRAGKPLKALEVPKPAAVKRALALNGHAPARIKPVADSWVVVPSLTYDLAEEAVDLIGVRVEYFGREGRAAAGAACTRSDEARHRRDGA